MGWVDAYLAIGFIGLSLACIFTTWYYARRGTPVMVYVACFLAMVSYSSCHLLTPCFMTQRNGMVVTVLCIFECSVTAH
jgi:peptidoglycan biosynthesis protein MviN/MurJ (putative lipid II flippase)